MFEEGLSPIYNVYKTIVYSNHTIIFFLLLERRNGEIMNAFDWDKADNIRAPYFFRAGKNYGPVYGVYIKNGHKDNARNWCNAGGSTGSNIMKTDESRTLGTFRCN